MNGRGGSSRLEVVGAGLTHVVRNVFEAVHRRTNLFERGVESRTTGKPGQAEKAETRREDPSMGLSWSSILATLSEF